jgi:HAD superfamily hydrolase (TIGR01490 family)
MDDPIKNAHRLAVFDLDGTLTKSDTYLAFLIGFVRKHPRYLAKTMGLPIDVLYFQLGLRDNAWLKEKFLTAVLGGVDRHKIECWSEEFVGRLARREFRTDALAQLDFHLQARHRVILASASFDFYVADIAKLLRIPEVLCTRAEWTADGYLSGRIAGKNCYAGEKLTRLKAMLEPDRHQYHIVAYTDHHSDLPLLRFADEGVAVRPTHRLQHLCRLHGFRTVHWS